MFESGVGVRVVVGRGLGRRGTTVVALLTAVGAVVTTLAPAGRYDTPVGATGTAVSGVVFQDYDSDGVNDTAIVVGQATDAPVRGIVVRAFDAAGTLVGDTTTATDGTWNIDVASAATTDVRVEFSIPSDDPVLAAYRPSFGTTTGASGSTSGTDVQFASAGDTGVNLAVNVPAEFCQNNPNIAVSRQCLGVDAATLAAPTVWVSNYRGGAYTTANGYSDLYADWSITTAATYGTTGSILGMAWNPVTKKIVNSAYLRRSVRMYESGGLPRPGALFATTPDSTSATADSQLGGTTTFLVDLETLLPGDQFSNTTPPASGVANAGFSGYVPTNAARGLGSTSNAVDSDIPAGSDGIYEEIGKAGIGDIDIDEEGTLWVVSLYTRHLYRVPMPADGSAPTSMTDAGSIVAPVTCTSGEPRPFGVTVWRGSLYLPVTCDGSGLYDPTAPTSSLDDRTLSMTVVRHLPTAGTFTTFAGPYPLHANGAPFKGAPFVGVPVADLDVWNPWTDTFSRSWERFAYWAAIHPAPMASDLQFDRDGSMIVSVRDRGQDQSMGAQTLNPDGSANTYFPIAIGDVYRVCRTGTGWTDSDYTFEGGPGCAKKFDNYTAATTTDDEWYFDNYGSPTQAHPDTSAGMIEQVPGFPEVLTTGMDPFQTTTDLTKNTYRSGGVSWMVNSSGNRQTAINSGGGVIYESQSAGVNTTGNFDKGNAMADVEALCDQAPLQIGDRLWLDADADGVQDPGEKPIAGVTVHLYDDAGVLVSTAVTNADGEYRFSSNFVEPADGGVTPDAAGGNLAPNTAYRIAFDDPDDRAPGGPLADLLVTDELQTTASTVDRDTAIDSDAAIADGDTYPTIAVPPLAPGDNHFGFDAGFTPLVAVGDIVWVDADADGVQDPGETGLPGTLVELFEPDGLTPVLAVDGTPATATTDANGNWFIDGLRPGDYRARFTPPGGYSLTTPLVGGAAADSDPDAETGMTGTFTLTGDTVGPMVTDSDPSTVARFVNRSIDAGVIPSVSVGDFVWFDLDRDGAQDLGEPGIEMVTLSITTLNGDPVLDVYGNPVSTTVTDAFGHYSFDDLPYGQYVVSVVAPGGYIPTIAGAGAPSADSSTGSATSTVLDQIGERDPTLDFGFVKPSVSLGDLVWLDSDRDGVQDAEESGIAGVTLTLTDADGNPVTDVYGNPVGPTTTDADGHYSFDELPFGEYVVHVVTPDGYTPTITDEGTAATDSSTGTAAARRLDTDGDRDPTLDFGFVVPAVSVGDLVWFDLDRDGIQGPAEPGIAGVSLTLTDLDGNPVTDVYGNPVGPTTTDADGHYSFDGLPVGQYVVTVTPPAGAAPTVAGQGTTDTDSSLDAATSAPLTDDGARDTTLDFGFVPTVSVGDLVWFDLDRDGIQDPAEPGIAGVTLTLTDLDGNPVTDVYGNPVGPTTTDADGHYSFDDLPLGQYTVTITPPAGYLPTITDQGNTDIDSSTGSATSVQLDTNGQRDPTLDFGFVVPAVSVGDLVWFDLDRDGIQDPAEPGIAGVTLTLTDLDGNPVTDVYGNPVGPTTTDAFGHYSFDDLPLGQYTVTITPPAGYLPTITDQGNTDIDSSTGSATSTELISDGDRDPTLDFGLVSPMVAVSDRVWLDANGNGLQDPGERGVPGATLLLTDLLGNPVTDVFGNPVGPVVTDAEGTYVFEGLPPGRYVVRVVPPAGYTLTTPGSATSIELSADGASDVTLDFGLVASASLPVAGNDPGDGMTLATLLVILGALVTTAAAGRRRHIHD